MEYMIMPLKRYADFNGRSRRTEYWMFALFNVLVWIALIILMFGTIGGMATSLAGGSVSTIFAGFNVIILILMAVWSLGSIIPTLAVTVRRFHDQDKSGWYALVMFVPFFGGLILLIFMCLEGTKGPNRYGDDPKSTTSIVFE